MASHDFRLALSSFLCYLLLVLSFPALSYHPCHSLEQSRPFICLPMLLWPRALPSLDLSSNAVMASGTSIPSPKLTNLRHMASIIHIHLGMIDRMELWPPSHPAQVCRPQFSYHLPQPLLIMLKLIILSLRHAHLNSPINSSHLL